MDSDTQRVLRERHCLPGPEQGARGAGAQEQLEYEEDLLDVPGDMGVLVKEPRSNSDSDSGSQRLHQQPPMSQQTMALLQGEGCWEPS